MSAYSFNLIEEPWIPCMRLDGTLAELALRDTFAMAHGLREIRGETPLETAALHRLMLAILHRVFGPNTVADWKKLWGRARIDTIPLDEYLLNPSIFSAFNLFDSQKPFFQPRKAALQVSVSADTARVPGERRKGKQSLDELLVRLASDENTEEQRTPIGSLVIHAASGNNSTLFDHTTEAIGLCLTPARAARSLIASQLFGLGGTSSIAENFVDAPGSKGTIFLAYGDNLFETLLLNLILYGDDPVIPAPNDDDCPSWEMFDPFAPVRSRPRGYLDYLTWHNRRVWLFPEQLGDRVVVRRMVWAPGLTLDDEIFDPMKHFAVDREGAVQPLCFSQERALWRDSSVLYGMASDVKPPVIVHWLARLAQPPHSVIETTRQYRLMALGLSKSKASLEFLRSESLPLSPGLLIESDRVGDLSHALEAAENAARAIRQSVFLVAWILLYPKTEDNVFDTNEKVENKIAKGRYSKSDDKDAQHAYRLSESWGVERIFWSNLEHHVHRLIQDLPDKPETAVQEWRQVVRRTAKAAFAQAESYAGNDLRAQRAAALARQLFDRRLAAALGKASTVDNTIGGDQA